jgi:two-component system alkaline phosphatase synthesis response regulator PhoP
MVRENMATDSKRILVAEDNVALAGVVRFNLQRAGYQVDTVTNGRRAWELLQHVDFDLLVLDHQMPEMTGVELCRKIRQDARLRKTPVIMLTAKKFELEADVLYGELGVLDVISKPFSPRAFERTVERCISPPVATA